MKLSLALGLLIATLYNAELSEPKRIKIDNFLSENQNLK